MTTLEQDVYDQVRAIISNEEQVLGRRDILTPLKKALINEADIRIVIDTVSADPALAAHLLIRANTAQAAGVVQSKNRSVKDALIRLGQVNIYRYAFAFYLKERLDSLDEPYRKLVHGYWQLTEDIAVSSLEVLRQEEDAGNKLAIDADEVQTLALFSVFGQVITLTAFAYLNADAEPPLSLRIVKAIIDKQQQILSVEAFESLGLDEELRSEFMIAHNLAQTQNPNSAGLVLRKVLSKRGLLINPL
ncbi:HDOD domain-containing protein [Shewanella intestini]|uniref:HDOD domain-containing protein n=1 Tax=Shewanella intestini TaxID=2017544 RepID=A0ABS5I497_9GAMM|nr:MULTISPECIES: HDOD domain-containing protein [Shewanella]MBR9728519.1 HDOD domain-containing protein [Shewanella intestini]MRG36338.1 HDOD domain-containing protein [Shewanella sp. XMDDZSB0408]